MVDGELWCEVDKDFVCGSNVVYITLECKGLIQCAICYLCKSSQEISGIVQKN